MGVNIKVAKRHGKESNMKKNRLILLGASALLFASGLAVSQVPTPVMAEGEEASETSEIVSSEANTEVVSGEASSEQEHSMTELQYWKDLYERFVIPLLGTTNVVSIITAILGIALSLKRHKAEIKHFGVEAEQYAKYAALIDKAYDVIELCRKSVEVSEKASEDVKAYVKSFMELGNAFLDEVKKVLSSTKELKKLQPLFAKLSEILGKMAAHTKELVSSGTAQEVLAIAQEARELAVNG